MTPLKIRPLINCSFYSVISLISLLSFTSGKAQNSCDTISYSSCEFAEKFQKKFDKINSDSILGVTYTSGTNGCSYKFGVLAWTKKGSIKVKVFKNEPFFHRKLFVGNRTKKIVNQFFTDSIYKVTGEVTGAMFVDDGSWTTVVFKTKQDCWRHGHNIADKSDPRVKWSEELKSHFIQ
ncbi:hypothetical protein [Salibacter halophilus]|uniref:Uncharacterized protein n=1 Tax=Salibacter halophilus TaxID=1803916 RepID=A0A6N6M9C3_9FLAO|nr:hypothetical protein [Salibacter halophilus]KAB1065686.1 hypothetical protein F3059_03250 [Salibacter halophilus]